MKKSFYLSMLLCMAIVSCSSYDDADVKDDIEDLQDRVSTLESRVSSLNDQISSMQSAVAAIQSLNFVTGVTTVTSGGVITGYTISFSDNTSITITNGTDGTSGTTGSTPVIGVVLVDGVYYWTLDGVPISDSDGNMIPASSSDGETGSTPQLKIEDDYWWVSYDGGTTWTQLGEVSEDDEVEYITAVEEDDYYVYITLYDGTVLTLQKEVKLEISFDMPTVGFESAGETIEITYTVTSGADNQTVVQALASDGYSASVTAASTESGTISITAPDDTVVDSEVLVLVSNTTKTILRTINIKSGGFISVTTSSVTATCESGEILVPVTTNLEYTVSIPSDADWLSYTETRAMRTDTLVFTASANSSLESRYTTVTLTATSDNSVIETVLITQEGITLTINDNWDVSYYGKYYSGYYGAYYDRVDFTDGDETRYKNMVFNALYIDTITTDSLFTYMQEYLEYYVDYYDSAYYDGYYVENACYTETKNLLYSSLESGSYYYGFMFGVSDDGTLTGEYQVSERFTPASLEASDEYSAWLGIWSYTDSDGNEGTLTFSQLEAEVSYNMAQNASSGFWDVEVGFNSSDGSVTIYAVQTDGSGTSSSYGDYLVYWYPYITRDGTNYYVSGTGYAIATGTVSSDGTTATITPEDVELSSGGTYTITYMGYIAILTSGSGALTFTYAPKISLPLDLTYSSSLTANQASTTDKTDKVSKTSVETIFVDPAMTNDGARIVLTAD